MSESKFVRGVGKIKILVVGGDPKGSLGRSFCMTRGKNGAKNEVISL